VPASVTVLSQVKLLTVEALQKNAVSSRVSVVNYSNNIINFILYLDWM
jgi:hypothetical protein